MLCGISLVVGLSLFEPCGKIRNILRIVLALRIAAGLRCKTGALRLCGRRISLEKIVVDNIRHQLKALESIALYRTADNAVSRAVTARHNAGIVIGGFPGGFLVIDKYLSVRNSLCKLNGVVDICRDIAERGNSLSRSVDIVIFLRARNLGGGS